MTDASIYIQNALDANPLREPLLRSVIQSLQLPPGSHGLDAGCGIGLQAMLLAEAAGSQGQITGMDILPELLAYGQANVSQAAYANRITFCAGDVSRFPFADHPSIGPER
jgi:demethylmenaquinone methyltransferase/2-methoxy-6-polyprenyl-1,4-benzoquinol methylase